MKRQLFAVALALVAVLFLVLPVLLMAQEAPAVAEAAIEQATKAPSFFESLLKLVVTVLPLLLAPLGSYITHAAQALNGKIPTKFLPVISSVSGALIAFLAAFAFPGGIPPDMAASIGLVSGGAGHALTQTNPIAAPAKTETPA